MKALYGILLVLIGLVAFPERILAQQTQGKILETLSIDSKILQKSVSYTAYLPPDYDFSVRSYPIVYLLHGYSDDHTAWVQFGQINRIADQGIAEGRFPPMIIIMPDAEVTWYINNFDGSVRYEDFFFEELMPEVETRFRIRRKKEFRAIAGLSMGGYGAAIYALKHPDLFAATAPLSAALYTEEIVLAQSQDRWDRVEGLIYGSVSTPQDRLTDHWKANNPFWVANQDAEKLKQVRYYIDCGDDDFLTNGNVEFHMLLKQLDIKHEFRIRDGGHTWSYWRQGIADAFTFFAESFHR